MNLDSKATRSSAPSLVLAQNKRAYHEYEITEKYLAGVALLGTEVKSVRAGKVNLTDGWIDARDDGTILLKMARISPYSHGTHSNHDEMRPRALLLRQREINEIKKAIHTRGFTCVPLRVILKGSWIKVEIGIGRGKKLYDKRSALKEKEANLDLKRAMKDARK